MLSLFLSVLLASTFAPSVAPAFFPAVGAELEVPTRTGWVTDLAGLLTAAQERDLSMLMESYRSGSGHEVALLTIPSLEGDVLESFSLRVAEDWGMGGAERDEGVLLLIAHRDRRMRIETGYGLEGNLPDIVCGRILEDVMAPRFRDGDWYGGIRSGVEAIHAAAGGDYGPIERTSGGRKRSSGLFGFALMAFFLLSMAGGRRGRRSSGLGGALPWLIMSSMSSGRGGDGGGFSGGGGDGFGGFSGGGGFGGGGASGGW